MAAVEESNRISSVVQPEVDMVNMVISDVPEGGFTLSEPPLGGWLAYTRPARPTWVEVVTVIPALANDDGNVNANDSDS